MSNLAPIAPQCASESPTTLVLEEKISITGDAAKINDAEGNLLFEVDAHLMTMSGRRVIKDASGAELGQIRRKKTPGLHPTMYVGTMGDEKKCAVKSKGILNPLNCNAEICLGDNVIGEVTGNWRAKTYTISIDGNQVAEVKRAASVAGVVLSHDTYCIEIAAGVDSAFISMVVIALDELYHD